MTEMTQITITNVHDRGFAFAVTETGEQTFIPPHTAAMVTGLAAGDTTAAVLVPNPRQDGAAITPTPWLAVKLIDSAGPDPEPEPEPVSEDATPTPSAYRIDDRAYAALETVAYASNNDIASMLGEDIKAVSNAMQRLFNAGRISRSEVHHRVGQQRPSFLLYAIAASDFVEGDD